jgi:hypothetical protein
VLSAIIRQYHNRAIAMLATDQRFSRSLTVFPCSVTRT